MWIVAKHELYKQLDQGIVQQAVASGPFGGLTMQVAANGSRSGRLRNSIPVTNSMVEVAAGQRDSYFVDVTLEGTRFREGVLASNPPGEAFVTVSRLQPTLHALARIRFWILLVGGLGMPG